MERIVILGGGEWCRSNSLIKPKGFDVFLPIYLEIKPQYKTLLNEYGIEWEEKQHTEDKYWMQMK